MCLFAHECGRSLIGIYWKTIGETHLYDGLDISLDKGAVFIIIFKLLKLSFDGIHTFFKIVDVSGQLLYGEPAQDN